MKTIRIAVISLFSLLLMNQCKSRNDQSQLREFSGNREEACLFGSSTLPVMGSSGAEQLDLLTWKIIGSLAEASEAAYLNAAGVEQKAKSWGYPNVEHFVYDSMYGYLMTNDKCAVLVFRGTDMKSFRDWMVNFKASTVNLKSDGAVHKGFYTAATNLYTQVIRALKREGVSRKNFWVTGHSLGGALAGVFAYKSKFERWIGDGPDMHKVVTFGQPLFADAVLAKKMRNTFINVYYRVVNETDLVAKVPFWMKHFGSLVWLRNGNVDFRPDRYLATGGHGSGKPEVAEADIPKELTADEEAYQEFLEQTKNLPQGQVMPDHIRVMGGIEWPKFLDDHLMGNYIRRINREIDEYK